MSFKKPTNNYQALVLALSLAISAPTKAQCKEALLYGEILIEDMTPCDIERAKNEALALLETEQKLDETVTDEA